MIHSFSFKNFYSFADNANVSFIVNEKAPKSSAYFSSPSGTRLSKLEAVIGPNASGKTNLLKVIPFFKWLILDSFNLHPTVDIPIKPFLFDKGNKPIDLSLVFESKSSIYEYSFKLNTERILEEELKVRNVTNVRSTFKTLFYRVWNKATKEYDLNDIGFNLPKDFRKLVRSNASIVSTAIRLNHQISLDLSQFFHNIQTNVVEEGWVGDSLAPNSNMIALEALHFYSENDVLKSEAEKLLRRFDLGLEGFDIKKEKKGEDIYLNAAGIHSFNGKRFLLPISNESSGTKQLLILLRSILLSLKNGGIAIIDEFDVKLHPEMISSLLDLFLNEETNTKNAQMIFSSHSHRILNKLDKYQIILVEKNNKGSSETWRLDEIEGVRSDDNYYAKYIAGAYGAIPDIS